MYLLKEKTLAKQTQHLDTETVRYYPVDNWDNEKFPKTGHTLREWREMTKKLSPDELDRFRELIEEALLNNKEKL